MLSTSYGRNIFLFHFGSFTDDRVKDEKEAFDFLEANKY
jgi:hypothetical protein